MQDVLMICLYTEFFLLIFLFFTNESFYVVRIGYIKNKTKHRQTQLITRKNTIIYREEIRLMPMVFYPIKA